MTLFYLLVLLSTIDCSELLHRRRRFAELFKKFWVTDDPEQYAVPEKIVKFAEPSSPYDSLNSYDYLGRPAPLLARLMKWDQPYEELGPTFSRLLGLSKVSYLVEKPLIFHCKLFCPGSIRAHGRDTVISNERTWSGGFIDS